MLPSLISLLKLKVRDEIAAGLVDWGSKSLIGLNGLKVGWYLFN